MVPFRAAGLTYIKYSQICANAVRSCLKAEQQAAAQTRASRSVIFRSWTDGKPVGKFTQLPVCRILILNIVSCLCHTFIILEVSKSTHSRSDACMFSVFKIKSRRWGRPSICWSYFSGCWSIIDEDQAFHRLHFNCSFFNQTYIIMLFRIKFNLWLSITLLIDVYQTYRMDTDTDVLCWSLSSHLIPLIDSSFSL